MANHPTLIALASTAYLFLSMVRTHAEPPTQREAFPSATDNEGTYTDYCKVGGFTALPSPATQAFVAHVNDIREQRLEP